MVPKLIHKIAPSDKNKWHALWKICDESWKKHFPEEEYEYKYWDLEEMDELVAQEFPQYYEIYKGFRWTILKLDWIRFVILYKYGGIYGDMDYYVYKNFYKDISTSWMFGQAGERETKSCWILEAWFNLSRNPARKTYESVQNSLMVSAPGQIFWVRCIEDSLDDYLCDRYPLLQNDPDLTSFDGNVYIKDIAGPRFLSRAYANYPNYVNLINRDFFNPHYGFYHNLLRGKHMMTGQWGEEQYDIMMKKVEARRAEDPDIDYAKYSLEDYNGHRGLDPALIEWDKNYCDFYNVYGL